MKTLKDVATSLKNRAASISRRTTIDDINLCEYVSTTSDYAETIINLHDIDADSIVIRDTELYSGRTVKIIECLTLSGERRDITLFLDK